jgi:hypothetical protein
MLNEVQAQALRRIVGGDRSRRTDEKDHLDRAPELVAEVAMRMPPLSLALPRPRTRRDAAATLN